MADPTYYCGASGDGSSDPERQPRTEQPEPAQFCAWCSGDVFYPVSIAGAGIFCTLQHAGFYLFKQHQTRQTCARCETVRHDA